MAKAKKKGSKAKLASYAKKRLPAKNPSQHAKKLLKKHAPKGKKK